MAIFFKILTWTAYNHLWFLFYFLFNYTMKIKWNLPSRSKNLVLSRQGEVHNCWSCTIGWKGTSVINICTPVPEVLKILDAKATGLPTKVCTCKGNSFSQTTSNCPDEVTIRYTDSHTIQSWVQGFLKCARLPWKISSHILLKHENLRCKKVTYHEIIT